MHFVYRHHLNSSKNRPGAPLPPDTSARVKLQPLDCAEGFDYINAWWAYAFLHHSITSPRTLKTSL